MPETIRVLYVDDEPDLLALGKIFLEESGSLAVNTFTSARKVLETPALSSCDVIVSDYHMSDMDGIAFLKEVRSRAQDLPFILFTGRGREEVVIEAINNGADFYIQKGGTPAAQFAELAHKIRQADRRYRTEKALRQSEERYRSIVDDQEEMIARFTPEGNLTFVNRAFAEYYGPILRIDTLDGKNIHDLMRERNTPSVNQFLAAITPDKPLAHTEREFIDRDGGRHWQAWSVRGLFFPDGTPREYQVVGNDITALKSTEAELRNAYDQLSTRDEELRKQYRLMALNEMVLAEREEAYRTLFEQSPAAITLSTMSGEYADVNPHFCELVDLPRSVLIGRTPQEIWPSYGSGDTRDVVQAFEESGGILDRREMLIPFRGGPSRRCRISSRVIRYHNEPHVLTLIYDIEGE